MPEQSPCASTTSSTPWAAAAYPYLKSLIFESYLQSVSLGLGLGHYACDRPHPPPYAIAHCHGFAHTRARLSKRPYKLWLPFATMLALSLASRTPLILVPPYHCRSCMHLSLQDSPPRTVTRPLPPHTLPLQHSSLFKKNTEPPLSVRNHRGPVVCLRPFLRQLVEGYP